MNIGPAVESDLPELIDMLCLAYRPELRGRFEAHVYEDCTYEPHQSRVGKLDGKIVSYARVSDRPIRIGRCVVRMGGLGAVSTHPDYRGRGYNTLILKDAIRYMEQQGYDISMLFTGIPDHYGKLGWTTFPEHTISVEPVAVPGAAGNRSQPPFRLRESACDGGVDYAFRPFDEKRDLDDVIRIYDEHNKERTGTLVRTPDYWRCGHSRFMGVMPSVVAERDGELVAYVKCGVCDRAVSVPEVGYLPEHPDAVWAMARFLVNHAIEQDARQIRFRLGRLHPLPEIVCEIGNGRKSLSAGEGMMLRVISLSTLLRKLAPELGQRLRRSGASDMEATIAFAAGEHCATLHIGNGTVRVEEGMSGRVELSLDTRTMLRMIMGDATFCQMSALHDVHGVRASVRTAALLDVLFPNRDPVFWGCDHF